MKQKVRKMSITLKLLLPVTLVMFLVCSTLGMFAYNTVQEEMMFMASMQAQTVATLAAESLDPNCIATLKPGDEERTFYTVQKQILIDIQASANMKYVYTLYTDGETVYYGIDADLNTHYPCR